jgi:hypothetical protein
MLKVVSVQDRYIVEYDTIVREITRVRKAGYYDSISKDQFSQQAWKVITRWTRREIERTANKPQAVPC